MSEFLKKELGAWILIITGAFGAVLIEYIILLGWSLLWIGFIGITWYASAGLISSLVWHYLKVRKSDIPILTKVDPSITLNEGLTSSTGTDVPIPETTP